MKIFHTSDLHLESALTTRLSSDKVRERKRELLSSFRRSVELAEAEGAEVYVIAGDLFDTEKATSRTLDDVIYTVSSHPNITFFYLFGNHEGELILKKKSELPENLKLFDSEWTYYEISGVCFIGRTECSENMFDSITLDEKKTNIVILHGELLDHSGADSIGKKEIESLPIDYLALGHYHTYSAVKIGKRTTAVYSGTPEGRGFDEAGEKGGVLIETDGGEISHRFIPTAKRTLHIIELDLSEATCAAEIEDLVADATAKIPSADIVRALLIGKRDILLRIDTAHLSEIFKRRFYYFEAKDNTRAKICAEDFKNDHSLKGEFIRCVINNEKLSESEREKVIIAGISALLGEEIE